MPTSATITEIITTSTLKASDGFSKFWPTLVTIVEILVPSAFYRSV